MSHCKLRSIFHIVNFGATQHIPKIDIEYEQIAEKEYRHRT